MKDKFSSFLYKLDRQKLETVLLILVPILTLIIIISIIAPTIMLSRHRTAAPEYAEHDAFTETVNDTAVSEEVYANSVQENIVVDGSIYRYDFSTGENGAIISSDGNDSGVYPIDANGDGAVDFGFKWIAEESEDNPKNGHYATVALFKADGTPKDEFRSELVPADKYTPSGAWEENRYRYSNGKLAVGLKTINGKLYYFNNNGEAAQKLGVDVSFYNDYIDWPLVQAQGIDFAIIRVGGRGWSTGSIYDDSAFTRNINEAQKAGIKLGVYFYSTAVNAREAEEEARYVIANLNGIKLDYPVYIDMEQSGNYPRGRSDKLTKAERAEVINSFCRVVAENGYKTGVYSSAHYLRHMVEYSAISQYDIWLAHYTYNHKMPTFSDRYDMWQFTEHGLVRGIPGGVDLNAIY